MAGSGRIAAKKALITLDGAYMSKPFDLSIDGRIFCDCVLTGSDISATLVPTSGAVYNTPIPEQFRTQFRIVLRLASDKVVVTNPMRRRSRQFISKKK